MSLKLKKKLSKNSSVLFFVSRVSKKPTLSTNLRVCIYRNNPVFWVGLFKYWYQNLSIVFRDQLLAQFKTIKEGDLDAISAKLDILGNTLEYRKYGDSLFEILITGGILGKSIDYREREISVVLNM